MNYYNDNDPHAAAWLRELIRGKHIPAGFVDERSILEVKAAELAGYRQCHFFAGIGGWPLALSLAGVPEDEEIWTGSCPCQPLSSAGLQLGHADERHIWPAFFNLISERKPAKVFGEQVASADGREWLAGIRADLEGVGYACGAADLCAAGVGSPNIRQRIYWMAHAQSEREGSESGSTRKRISLSDGSVGSCGMADSESGDRGLPICEREPSEKGAEPIGGSEVGGLADADGGKSRDGGIQRSGEHGQQPENDRACRVVHPDSERGCSGQSGGEDATDAGLASEAGNFWSSYDLLPCTDGKARRIEPGSFPLAHGVPGRVGLLRGYGNAICPQLAAVFIQASMTAKP